jgi:BASS family bile acid:Na+ symporter
MPFVGYALAHLLKFPMEIASGVILIGCVSSALASNVMSYISGANLALAITIGAFSTIISPFLTPFLMKTLAGQYLQVDVLDMMVDITNMVIIPIVAGFIFNLFYYAIESRRNVILQLLIFAIIIAGNNLILMVSLGEGLTGFIYSFSKSMLFFYLLPILLAILFKYFLKDNRSLIEKSFAFVAMMGIVFNTAIITASGRNNLIEVGGLLILSCLIHNLLGLTLGYSVAWLFKMPEKDCRTIAFEVGMQNGGIATGLALEMGRVATVGLASTIIGPLQNVTGSALANYFRSHPIKDNQRNTDNTSLDNNNSFSIITEEQVVEVESMEEMPK